ncbi:MAG: molybdopterin/thiamine biosynthesis adenylyltransferase [Patescibacteria group bacterium]|jgi:molybdopterin/thiamine biosynthesis adenylyltransferase
MTHIESQHDRQNRITGFDQNAISNTKVCILGNNLASQLVLASSVAMGFGDITLLDNQKSAKGDIDIFYPSWPFVGHDRSQTIAYNAGKIDENISVKGYSSLFNPHDIGVMYEKPDVIIDLTQDKNLKEESLVYASREGISYVSGFINHSQGQVSVYDSKRQNYNDILLPKGDFDSITDPGIIPSGVSSGIIMDEIRKNLFRYNDFDLPLTDPFVYNLLSSSRSSPDNDVEFIKSRLDERILVAGAGAIGTYVALGLAYSCFNNFDILDCDDAEKTNLNRQILYYDSLGEHKAKALSTKLEELTTVKPKFHDMRIDENSLDFIRDQGYTTLFGCFDNMNARFYLNDIAKELGINYIDGGSSPHGGKVVNYITETYSCVGCTKNLTLEDKSYGCAREPDASIINSNMLVGSTMVGELYHNNGESSVPSLSYSQQEEPRIKVNFEVSPQENCGCKI